MWPPSLLHTPHTLQAHKSASVVSPLRTYNCLHRLGPNKYKLRHYTLAHSTKPSYAAQGGLVCTLLRDFSNRLGIHDVVVLYK